MSNGQITMNISVVLCTYNNCRLLQSTLTEIQKCKIPETLTWELVVVNNNSSDDTDAVVQEFECKLPIVYVYERQQGLSKARNAGLAAASGEYVLFCDDDIFPNEDWIASYWDGIESSTERRFFGGSVQSVFEGDTPAPELIQYAPWSVKGLDLGNKERLLSNEESFLSANWCCPKAEIIAVGGFDEKLGLMGDGPVRVGEETDLQLRLRELGLKPYYLPNAVIGHFVPKSKCTREHIASRRAATMTLSQNALAFDYNGPLLFNVPRWMVRKTVEKFVTYYLQRFRGRSGIHEYMEYRSLLSIIHNCRRQTEIDR